MSASDSDDDFFGGVGDVSDVQDVEERQLLIDLELLETLVFRSEPADEQLAAQRAAAASAEAQAPGSEWAALQTEVVEAAAALVQGEYCPVLGRAPLARLAAAVEGDQGDGHAGERLGRAVRAVVCAPVPDDCEADEADVRALRVAALHLAAVAALCGYLQSNYTGPSLDAEAAAAAALPWAGDAAAVAAALALEGEELHVHAEHADWLLLARAVLPAVGAPHLEGAWGLDAGFAPVAARVLRFGDWWAARAVVAHQRAMATTDPIGPLRAMATDCFAGVLRRFATPGATGALAAQAWLEWGLAQHHFGTAKKGKDSFASAKKASQLRVELTGLMGKRTKYQQKSTAQLVLLARSAVSPSEEGGSAAAEALASSSSAGGAAETETKTEAETETKTEPQPQPPQPPQAEEDLPDTLPGDLPGEQVQEAVIRTAAHEDDSHLLERVQFDEADLSSSCNLQLLDQAIILALCLDVGNSNPKDGLTAEEMQPYLARVLENPNNWMVYSTALLERAWLDFERAHARERAVLQLQALVDQHTTRLTMTQSTFDSIEESAPAQERLQLIHAIVFPPRWELRRGLAERYAKLGILRSAAEIFEDLQLWDELVDCYRLMEENAKAERLVRERLAVNPTPQMWCALGDATGDLDCYERSWELSNGRFSRAKRTWARRLFERGELEDCVAHLADALRAAPLDSATWFFKGAVCMRLDRFDDALHAYTRVVQQEPEEGEAWGNIGAIHCRMNNPAAAYHALQEGVRLKRENWRMWENLLNVVDELGRVDETIYAMHRLLELRHKSERPVNVAVLANLVRVVAFPSAPVEEASAGEDDDEEELDDGDMPPPALAADEEADERKAGDGGDELAAAVAAAEAHVGASHREKLRELLEAVVACVTSDRRIWGIYGKFCEGVGDAAGVLDCRVKELRTVQAPNWWLDADLIANVAECAARAADAYVAEGSDNSLQAARLMLQGLMRRVEADFSGSEGYAVMEAAMGRVSSASGGAAAGASS